MNKSIVMWWKSKTPREKKILYGVAVLSVAVALLQGLEPGYKKNQSLKVEKETLHQQLEQKKKEVKNLETHYRSLKRKEAIPEETHDQKEWSEQDMKDWNDFMGKMNQNGVLKKIEWKHSGGLAEGFTSKYEHELNVELEGSWMELQQWMEDRKQRKPMKVMRWVLKPLDTSIRMEMTVKVLSKEPYWKESQSHAL